LNHQEDSRLEHFLFGVDRLDLSVTRSPLWEIQESRCFYCQERIREPKESHVDHFIPWSRYQENGLSNLVIADVKCNGNKSDFHSYSLNSEGPKSLLTLRIPLLVRRGMRPQCASAPTVDLRRN